MLYVAGIKPGHMPDAINVPFSSLLDLKEKRLKPRGDLLDVLDQAGVDISKPIVACCGTGMATLHGYVDMKCKYILEFSM